MKKVQCQSNTHTVKEQRKTYKDATTNIHLFKTIQLPVKKHSSPHHDESQ